MTRKAGPTPYRRTPLTTKATEGLAVLELIYGQGLSFRQAAQQLGMSATTCWRRHHWIQDWLLPGRYGVQAKCLPPQRGTRACPRGRPWIAELDDVGGPLHLDGRHMTASREGATR